MSHREFFVAVIGLVCGYLLISFLMRGKKRGDDRSAVDEDDASGSSGFDEPASRRAVPATSADDWATVLGISPFAGEAEIRKAYRSLMSQYHPDKVASLGPEIRALAERKSKDITVAYAAAMKARGFSD